MEAIVFVTIHDEKLKDIDLTNGVAIFDSFRVALKEMKARVGKDFEGYNAEWMDESTWAGPEFRCKIAKDDIPVAEIYISTLFEPDSPY